MQNFKEFLSKTKVELHVHIEGATTPDTYFKLAEKNRVKLPCDTIEEWRAFFNFKDFGHFIKVYETAVSCIQKAEDLSTIIEDFFLHQKTHGIIYSEAFLSASLLIQKFKQAEIIDAIQVGLEEGERKHQVKVQLIPDIARHEPDSQTQVLDLAIEGFRKGVFIGLGLGGLEINYPPHLFTDTFKIAKDAGLKTVAHAGEAVGPESIWGAIKDLKVNRIGHGIRCVDDPKLMDYLAQNQIPIEVCPTSNYHLGVTDKSQNHPIRKMMDHGILCNLNTDDPAMFSTNITQEYELLKSQGFQIDELIELNRNAIRSSFLSREEKEELLD